MLNVTDRPNNHYKECVIEPIEVIQCMLSKERFKGFILGNILKYRLRAGHKGPAADDIEKARVYEDWLRQLEAEEKKNKDGK